MRPTFSERQGLVEVRTVVQMGFMDDALRNRLWNILKLYLLKKIESSYYSHSEKPEIYYLLIKIWHHLFKQPIDLIEEHGYAVYEQIKDIYFKSQWFEVYDFIEFIYQNYPWEDNSLSFKESCNLVLKEEMSAYRFVGYIISPITDEEEIASIEEAIEKTKQPIAEHLSSALQKLSDRDNPDYRNSIKESISAVETICRIITGDDKATLGEALNAIEKHLSIHPALKSGFEKIYGYTCDEGGVRHSLMNESNLDFEDAKFMLVSCSAFINYLKEKADKAGIII